MRAAAPSVIALAGCALVGCGGAQLGAVGASHSSDAPVIAIDAGAEASAPRASPIPGDFRATFTRVNPARFVSKGHAAGRWDTDVWADAAGLAAMRAGGVGGAAGAVPVGARFVEEHFERDGAGPIMMMEKRPPGFDPEHGDWRYVVVGARGEVVKDGAVESCAGCHGDAPRDHLFVVGDIAR